MKLFPLHILPNDTKIDFMRWRHVAMAVTIVVFLASVAIIGIKGFNYALDFTGGTLIETRFERPWTSSRSAPSWSRTASTVPRCRASVAIPTC